MRIVFIGPPARAKGRRPSGWSDISAWPISRPATCSARAREARPKSARRPTQYMSSGALVPDDIIVASSVRAAGAAGLRRRDTCWTVFRAPSPRPRRSTRCWPSGRRRWTRAGTSGARGGVVRRLAGRGRDDDTRGDPPAAGGLYDKQTEPLSGILPQRGLLKSIDGLGTVDEIFERRRRWFDAMAGSTPAVYRCKIDRSGLMAERAD